MEATLIVAAIIAVLFAGGSIVLFGWAARDYGKAAVMHGEAAEDHRKAGANYQASIDWLEAVKADFPVAERRSAGSES